MEDLTYIFSLGFTSADLPRAAAISFLLAMLFAPKNSIWALGFLALMIDKIVWPLTAQSLAGAGVETVVASIAALGETLVDDLGVYFVRYLGITIMIGLFNEMRVRVHGFAPMKKVAA